MNQTEIYSLLASAERRQVLIELWEGGGTTTVGELSRRMVAGDGGRSPDDATYVEIQLVHDHLPRLEDHDVIEYDERSGDVRLTPTGEKLEPILRATVKSTATIP